MLGLHPRRLLTVIVPLLNEEENIAAVHAALDEVAAKLDRDVELLFVDDGSTDHSFTRLVELRQHDPRVKVLRLARNFGSQGACLAGYSAAQGDHVVILSADLQDPPELIGELLRRADEGNDIVLGYRERRSDPAFTIFLSSLYNRLMGAIAMKNWPSTGFDFILVSRRVVQTLLAHPERNTSVFGQILWTGYSRASVPYTRRARRAGVSKWTMGKKIKLAVDSVIAFSYLPMRIMSLVGIVCACLGAVYAGYVGFMRLWHGEAITGWASLMVVLLVVSGVQMVMLGVIGEYLWRALDEVRGRPSFLVTDRVGFHSPADQPGTSVERAMNGGGLTAEQHGGLRC